MKLPMKSWFLYGTLFGVLGFTISGQDPRVEGSAHLSQLAPAPTGNSPAAAPAAPAQPQQRAATPAAPARQAAAPVTVAPVSTEVAARPSVAPATTVAPVTVQAAAPLAPQQPAVSRVAPGRVTQTTAPAKFEKYALFVEATGKTYQVHMYTENGTTKVVYYDKAEGKECASSECARTNPMAVFDGEMAGNLDAIMKDLRHSKIPEAEFKAKKKVNEDGETEDASAGYAFLERKINDRCKHLSDNAELKCKTERFIELLKADKSKSKGKAAKRERLITDDDGVEYFNEHLKTYLKDMLTHKYSMTGLNSTDPFSRSEELRELYNQKRDALKEKDVAKNLIKRLLKELDSTYKETRKAVTSLYKVSMEEQAQEAILNLRQMDISRRENDTMGFAFNRGSFLENYRHLGLLNHELYDSMTSGLYGARSSNIGSEYITEMLNSLLGDRKDITREYFTDRMLSMSNHPSLERVTNAARSGRGGGGTAAPLSSTSQIRALIEANGASRVGTGRSERGF